MLSIFYNMGISGSLLISKNCYLLKQSALKTFKRTRPSKFSEAFKITSLNIFQNNFNYLYLFLLLITCNNTCLDLQNGLIKMKVLGPLLLSNLLFNINQHVKSF
jgi:hypothetical protein